MLVLGFLACSIGAPTAAAASDRVVNGAPVALSAWEARWGSYVQLGTATAPSVDRSQFCGGVLIAPRVVVTARHCVGSHLVTDHPSDIVAFHEMGVGHASLGSIATARVTEIYLSPASDRGYFAAGADIAVLRLAESLPGTVPIAIARPGDAELWGSGRGRASGVMVGGFGLMKAGSIPKMLEPSGSPTRMREAELPIPSDARCRQVNPASSYPGKYLCAGVPDRPATVHDDGRSSCYGDSGGPLIALRGSKPPVLIGLVSHGIEMQCTKGYGLYTRISRYATWLDRFDLADSARGGWNGLSAPTVTSAVGASGGRANVRWVAPAEGPSVQKYEVLMRMFFGSWIVVDTVRGTSATVQLPKTNLKWVRLGVRAVHSNGNRSRIAPSGSSVENSRVDTSPPTPPLRLTVRRTGPLVHLAWSAGRDRDAKIAGYYVEKRAPRSNRWKYEAELICFECIATKRSFGATRSTHVGIKPGYSYRVWSIDSALKISRSPSPVAVDG